MDDKTSSSKLQTEESKKINNNLKIQKTKQRGVDSKTLVTARLPAPNPSLGLNDQYSGKEWRRVSVGTNMI